MLENLGGTLKRREINILLPLHGPIFRLFESFNEVMIAKLAWWVLFGRDSLCVKVLRAKYKVGNSWLQAPPVRAASFSWRGLESTKELLCNEACKRVGSGTNILV